MPTSYTLFFGTFIQLPRAPQDGKHTLLIQTGAVWVSAADGRIAGVDWSVQEESNLQTLMQKKGWIDDELCRPGEADSSLRGVRVVRTREERNEFFFPGFIDTHIHASQYPNLGIFGSSTLLDWLETYTFPLEASFGDQEDATATPKKAHTAYDQVVSRTLSNGTTCASYYATIHVPATNLLASICHSRGQRAFIGRVCMDNRDFCPSYYCDVSADDALAATKATVSHIHSLDANGDIIKPVITPRFAPSCSRLSLSMHSTLASCYSPPLHIQTHISENIPEVALVKEFFPECKTYADVYDMFGLLTPRTILAHAVHLTDAEKKLISSRRAKISHCPTSNSSLGSGICPVRSLIDSGITVGLGTDVGGGYSPSILEQVRQACLVSRLLQHTSSNGRGNESLSVEEGLFLGTRGGAAVVDMETEIGGFEVGMRFDAQLVELGPTKEDAVHAAEAVGAVDIFGWETWTEKVHKWVWRGDDRNVKGVWVNGRLVHSRV